MKQINVSEASNRQLDWLVCRAGGGAKDFRNWLAGYADYNMHHYTTNWSLMGPIIEREMIQLSTIYIIGISNDKWGAFLDDGQDFVQSMLGGPTLLIAAARCYVASKLGDEVEVPEELL